MDEDSGPKRREDDCDMVTSLQAAELSKNERCLHEAARKNQVDIIRQIIEKKAANINCKNNLDRTALHMAASQGHLPAVETLVKGKAAIDLPDKYGMTPLMWAAYFEHIQVLYFLYEKGANPSKTNKQGLGIVHFAAEKNSLELFHHIMSKHKRLKLDEPDNNGLTPFMTAANHNSVDVLQALIDRTVNFSVEDKHNRTAIHLAVTGGHQETLQILLQLPRLVELINQKDDQNRTALHYSCDMGDLDVTRTLLTGGADMSITTDREMTCLMLGAQKGHHDILRLLVLNGCDINAHSENGNTALHLAAIANLPDTCKLLIELGANIDIPNNRLQTPLHSSVEQNKPDSTEVLLLLGADLTVIDKTGKTPLLLASRGSYISLIDMIIKAQRYREKQSVKSSINNLDSTHSKESNGESIHESRTFDTTEHDQSPPETKVDELDNDMISPGEEDFEDAKIGNKDEKPPYRLKEFNQPYAEEFKVFLWRLAFKHLRPGDWQKLGAFWGFHKEHMLAIEHQQTDDQSYKQHGFRLLCIWFHGMYDSDTPVRELYCALVGIGRRELADRIRRELDDDISKIQSKSTKCSIL